MLVHLFVRQFYTNLNFAASFFWSHYNKASDLIDQISIELQTIKAELGITDDDFKQYSPQERTYLQGLQAEPPQETLHYQYVEALQDRAKQK